MSGTRIDLNSFKKIYPYLKRSPRYAWVYEQEQGGSTMATVTGELIRNIAIAPDSIIDEFWFSPTALTITAIKLYSATAPSSAAGSYIFQAIGTPPSESPRNLLSTSNFNLETLSSGTLTSMSLTSTTSNLVFPAGSLILLRFSSNNSDLTGDNLLVQVIYTYEAS